MTTNISLRLGAILWILCFQFFVAEQFVHQGWTTPYSWSDNYISDLAAVHCANRPPDLERFVCSPRHDWMNASFILQGALIAGGALLLGYGLPLGRLGKAGLAVVGVAGACLALVGLAPEDVSPGVHFTSATVHLLGSNLGILLLGAALLRYPPGFHRLGQWSLVAGCIGLLGLILLVGTSASGGVAPGAFERVGAYPIPVWLVGTGILFWVRCRAGTIAVSCPVEPRR